ncbi:WUSCHEL-related homeobox 11-like [Rutidosis leptorrhynchoides]|uniref:WUSCHEL-related homeobox 11-like n=1 Tax=Rutidosis leptorrhynchoides TaxID=125765 RepID=UPI003A9A306D
MEEIQPQSPNNTTSPTLTQCNHNNHNHNHNHNSNSNTSVERNEPVRSRWTPKPEQILILESIFNSGMVNPPKEETVKIRKLLEKFGSVGDANVFYWFQNRRSRSRRRQRQIQASLISSGSLEQHQQQQQQQQQQHVPVLSRCDGSIDHDQYNQDVAYTAATQGFVMQQPCLFPTMQSLLSPLAVGSSSYVISGQASSNFPEIEQTNSMPSSFLHLDTSKDHYEIASGVITVFINGVATEVESGPLNTKGMFGEDLMLVHSSGVPVPLDDCGFSLPGLQHGESYFLVKHTLLNYTNPI